MAFGLGQYWQYEIRKLMGVTDYNIPLVVASPFVAALIFCLLLLIGRGLRGLYRWLAKLLNRWIGRRARARRSAGSWWSASPMWSSAACCSRALSTS